MLANLKTLLGINCKQLVNDTLVSKMLIIYWNIHVRRGEYTMKITFYWISFTNCFADR